MQRLTFLVTTAVAAVVMLDGFDIQVIGFVAPALVTDFGIERSALGPALAASLLGMAFGSALIGAIGDRWGRRPTLLLSTVLFGSATLLAATAPNVETLAVWRFLTGMGLGGALPIATAFIAEFMPGRQSSWVMGVALAGVPVGGMLGALLAAQIIPAFGWRAVFVAGGLLPLLAALLVYFVLPESARFVAQQRALSGQRRRIAAIAAPFAPALRWDTTATLLVFLTNIFAVYAFFNWAPLVLTSMGFSLAAAVRGAFAFNLAGVAGSLCVAWMIPRLGSRWPLALAALSAALALGCICLLAIGWRSEIAPANATQYYLGLILGVAIAGAMLSAVQVGMYIVAAHVFPTECRGAGVGWALGAGRLGGILSSLAGGALLARSGAQGFFGCIGGVLLLTVAAVLLIRRHVPNPRSLRLQSMGNATSVTEKETLDEQSA